MIRALTVDPQEEPVVRAIGWILVVGSIPTFGVGFVYVLSGSTGALGACIMIGIVAFVVGAVTLQFAGHGMTSAEGPKSFDEVDSAPEPTTKPQDSGTVRPARTWTKTWLNTYLYVALGEFYLGLLFVVGGLASGTSADVEGGFGMGGIMWIIAAVFAFSAIRVAAKNRLHKTGLKGEATILSVDQTGAWINNNPVTVLDLRIKVDGHPAYDARHRETVPQVSIGQLTSGETLPVRVNPAKPSDFIIDWGGGDS